MINLNECLVSYHFQNDRQMRKQRIDAVLNGNLGQVIAEEWYKEAWRVLTDTGLMAVVTPDKKIIITYYFSTIEQAKMLYWHNYGRKVPEYLLNKINKNARMYNKIYGSSYKRDDLKH